MAQSPRVIDVSKTYTPVDPQIIEANRTSEGNDARQDRTEGVIAYEGYNFLPTMVGYKSYFGLNVVFDLPACPAGIKVDKVLIYEAWSRKNYLIVLSETGIYINPANVKQAPWQQPVVLAPPAPGAHYPWTTCVIDDRLYAYQERGAKYYVFTKVFNGIDVVEVTPNFLNMPEQLGIFKAGGRLGFWDSENSVAWSNFDDHSDFTPSITTLAGSAIFNEVRGPITSILTFGDGFVIYATNSIVYVARDLSNTFQWNPEVLMAGSGVAYPDQVVSASPDTIHYCYTGIGLHQVTPGRVEPIATTVTDMLRESKEPIMLRLIENRYLCLQLIDQRMVDGQLEFDSISYVDMGIYSSEYLDFMKPTPLSDIAFE